MEKEIEFCQETRIPHIGGATLKANLISVLSAASKEDLFERPAKIFQGIPPLVDSAPGPFLNWFFSQFFDGANVFPHVFTFTLGGGLWVKSGTDCHLLLAADSGKKYIFEIPETPAPTP